MKRKSGCWMGRRRHLHESWVKSPDAVLKRVRISTSMVAMLTTLGI